MYTAPRQMTLKIALVIPALVVMGLIGNDAFSQNGKTVKLAMQPGAAITLDTQPVVECIFEEMNREVEFVPVPWKRAQKGVEKGAFDGFFIASRNKNRDAYATASSALITSEWVYVVRYEQTLTPGNPAFKELDFAANVGTARHQWLISQKKLGNLNGNITSGLTAEDTWKMLLRKRFDVLLENGPNVRKMLAGNQFDKRKFRYSLARKVPLSVYFSNSFLKDEPGFLKSFNDNVVNCK